MVSKYKKSGGWFSESVRHGLSAKGISTGRNKKIDYGFIDQYGGQGVFDPFYDNPKDSDGDGVPDVYDLHPFNPEKSRSDWAKKEINMNKVADAFYDEDWDYFEKVFGTKPKNHLEAEKIMEDYKKTNYAKSEFKGYKIGRYPNGITLNPMEYILDKKHKIMEFKSIEDAKTFLKSKGVKNFKGIHFEKNIDKAKPEIKGQQLRIRAISPTKCTGRYGTQDVGKKGRLQRVACVTKDGWKTQSWRENLSQYNDKADAIKDLSSIKSLSPKKKSQAMKEINKYFRIKKSVLSVTEPYGAPLSRNAVDKEIVRRMR
jgi:hypothetical protein